MGVAATLPELSEWTLPEYCSSALTAQAYKMVILKLQLHDAIYRLRFYSNSLTRILLLSNSHKNVASIQKNQGNKSHRVIVALLYVYK